MSYKYIHYHNKYQLQHGRLYRPPIGASMAAPNTTHEIKRKLFLIVFITILKTNTPLLKRPLTLRFTT